MADGGRLYNMQFDLGNDSEGNWRGFSPDGPLTYDAFMAATPQERQEYFDYYRQLAATYPAHQQGTILGMSLRNILSNNRSAALLSPEQYRNIVSGLDPAFAQSLYQNLQGIVTAQQQAAADKDFGDYIGPAIGLAGLGLAGGLGLMGAGVIGGGAAGAGLGEAALGGASTGGTAAGSLGSGLSLGAGGVTGITPGVTAGGIGGGALGTGIGVGGGGAAGLAGAGATGLGALGAGYFAGETAYPVFGGLSSAAPALSGAGSAAAATGGTSALSRVLSGNGTMDDYLRLGGAALPGLIGAYAANQQANALSDLGDKYFNVGAPSRDRFEASFAPGFSMANEPGYQDALDQTTQTFLRQMSAQHGNPFDSPTAWAETLKGVNATFALPQLNEYRRLNAGAGGLASLTSAAPAAQTNAVNAEANIYNALGGAAADVITPPRTLEDVLRRNGIKFSLA